MQIPHSKLSLAGFKKEVEDSAEEAESSIFLDLTQFGYGYLGRRKDIWNFGPGWVSNNIISGINIHASISHKWIAASAGTRSISS
jgi:hypothetical protein